MKESRQEVNVRLLPLVMFGWAALKVSPEHQQLEQVINEISTLAHDPLMKLRWEMVGN